MMLYFTTGHDSLDEIRDCPCRVCRMRGVPYRHLCMSTEPFKGLGPNVFAVDIPESEVANTLYKNEFYTEPTQFYAVPRELIDGRKVTKSDYETMTGSPWNEWDITVLDNIHPDGTKTGQWSIAWMSARGAASGEVIQRANGFLSVRVRTTTDFDPDVDYIVIELHEEFLKQGKVKETWSAKTLAGRPPRWVIYPTEWQEWVNNPVVERSAIDYIIQHVPEVTDAVFFAADRDTKENRIRAWERVVHDIQTVLTSRNRRRVDLKRLPTESWTSVMAMSHRIAGRMSEYVDGPAWKPPVAQPLYANPEISGRIVLANEYGVHPKKGPGVDERPQDRSRRRKEKVSTEPQPLLETFDPSNPNREILDAQRKLAKPTYTGKADPKKDRSK